MWLYLKKKYIDFCRAHPLIYNNSKTWLLWNILVFLRTPLTTEIWSCKLVFSNLAVPNHQTTNNSFLSKICRLVKDGRAFFCEVLLSFDLSFPSFGQSVGRSVGRSVIISKKSGKLHFHAPIGALVFLLYRISGVVDVDVMRCVCLVLSEVKSIKLSSYLLSTLNRLIYNHSIGQFFKQSIN